MTPKERLIAALERRPTDRLPVTTHHLQAYFLCKYAGGMDGLEFHKKMGFDPIVWPCRYKPNEEKNQYRDEKTGVICSDEWEVETYNEEARSYPATRYVIHTPGGSYILSPSDHFFDADMKLIRAFTDEAGKCVY